MHKFRANCPSSVENIGKGCFSGCSSLTHIELPQFIRKIEENTFVLCISLVQISIPSSVRKIKCESFSKCTSLLQVSLKGYPKLEIVHNRAFHNYFSFREILNIFQSLCHFIFSLVI